jgi:ATP-binding cassette, subfamily B (MDR/TAP), member 4
VVVTICPVVIGPYLFLQLMKKYSEREMAAYAKAGGVAEEAFTNIRIVNAYAGQSKEVQRCEA